LSQAFLGFNKLRPTRLVPNKIRLVDGGTGLSRAENCFLRRCEYDIMVAMVFCHPGRWLVVLVFMLAVSSVSLSPHRSAARTGETGATREEDLGAKQESRIYRDLEDALARVQPLLDRYGYPAMFLAVLVEGVGLVAPGQTLLMAAALEAARGGLEIAWVLFWGLAAAVLGNTLGYVIGRRGGRPLLHKLRVNEKHLEHFAKYFSRFGPAIILLARFFDGLRQLNGLVAGLTQMPWREFSIYNFLGAGLWVGVWGLGTYLIDKEIAALHYTLRQAEPYILALSLLGLLAVLIYMLRPGRGAAG
jgi:membrane protein DedA with SNARE-associated domain